MLRKVLAPTTPRKASPSKQHTVATWSMGLGKSWWWRPFMFIRQATLAANPGGYAAEFHRH